MPANTTLKIKKLLTYSISALLCAGFIAATSARADDVKMISVEIPEPSGGSLVSSGQSSEDALLGPDSLLPAYTGAYTGDDEEDVEIDATFEGFGFDDNPIENGGFFFIPPDAIGAAGRDRLIGVVNTMIEARTKEGTLIWRDSLRDFFTTLTPLTFTFDPKVIYDQYEDRFLVVALELVIGGAPIDPGNISRILLAVSKTGKPATATAADWHYHAIDSKDSALFDGSSFDVLADYPGFEVDEEAVYVTANMFSFVPFGFFGGVRLWIVDKGCVC